MTRRAGLAWCGLLAWSVAATVQAQTVYRCGPDGRSYSQQPCPESRALEVEDARGADERREGEAAAARQARAAELLAQERRRRDATVPRVASLGRSASGDPAFAPTQGAGSKKAKGTDRKPRAHGKPHRAAAEGAR